MVGVGGAVRQGDGGGVGHAYGQDLDRDVLPEVGLLLLERVQPDEQEEPEAAKAEDEGVDDKPAAKKTAKSSSKTSDTES